MPACLAAEHTPKLAVIGDLDSPRGALELLAEIRDVDREGAPWTPDLPIIVVSPRGHELDMLRAFEAGADDFLARPGSVSRAAGAPASGSAPQRESRRARGG